MLGIDVVGGVDHVLVFEAAHYVGDGVVLANVGEELVPWGAAPAAECSAAALATSRCRGHGVLLLDRVLGEIGAYSQAIGLHF